MNFQPKTKTFDKLPKISKPLQLLSVRQIVSKLKEGKIFTKTTVGFHHSLNYKDTTGLGPFEAFGATFDFRKWLDEHLTPHYMVMDSDHLFLTFHKVGDTSSKRVLLLKNLEISEEEENASKKEILFLLRNRVKTKKKQRAEAKNEIMFIENIWLQIPLDDSFYFEETVKFLISRAKMEYQLDRLKTVILKKWMMFTSSDEESKESFASMAPSFNGRGSISSPRSPVKGASLNPAKPQTQILTHDMNLDQFVELCIDHLNVQKTNFELAQLFNEKDVDHSESIDQEEFVNIVACLIQRPEIEELVWQKYCDRKRQTMNSKQLQYFMKTEQHEDYSLKECQHCITSIKHCYYYHREEDGFVQTEFELPGQVIHQEKLSQHQFTRLMLSHAMNNAIDTSFYDHRVDEMTHPLSDYYISTITLSSIVSNNSSLSSILPSYNSSGAEMSFPDKLSMFFRQLLVVEGYRCIELEIIDGYEEPLVTFQSARYHNQHSLITAISSSVGGTTFSFRKLCEMITQHAFVTYKYPIIIILEGIETFRSKGQLDNLASIIKGAFKDNLLTSEELRKKTSSTYMPSPMELLSKVIVVAKQDDVNASAEVWHLKMPSEIMVIDGHQDEQHVLKSAKPQVPERVESVLEQAEKLEKSQALTEVICFNMQSLTRDEKHYSKEALTTPRRSVAEVSIQNLLDVQICNLLMHGMGSQLIIQNQKNIIKVSQNSSYIEYKNINPITGWNIGCQLISVNSVVKDKNLRLNKMKFEQNGCCGYVLKPSILRNFDMSLRADQCIDLCISVISTENLPSKLLSSQQQTLFMDYRLFPYCKIKIMEDIENEKQSKLSALAIYNGYSFVWNKSFTFTIRNLDLAVLRIQIYYNTSTLSTSKTQLSSVLYYPKSLKSKEEHRLFAAETIVPLKYLRPGYRCIPLHDEQGNMLKTSSLFCHFQLSKR